MVSMQIISVLASLLLLSTAAPEDSDATIVSCDDGSTDHFYRMYGSNYIDKYNYNDNHKAFIFKSSNYGNGFYNNNERCTLKLSTMETPKTIQIYFNDFDVEYATSCAHDKVCIGGVNYCGNWTTGFYHYYTIPAYRIFMIYFLTDSSVTQRGFDLRITSADSTTIYPSYEAISGDGSSIYSVNYDFVNASNYVGKCSDSYDTSAYPNDQPSKPNYDTNNHVSDPFPEDGAAF